MSEAAIADDKKVSDSLRRRKLMLVYIRDTLIARAADRRSSYAFLGGDPEWQASADGKIELRRIVALEAAADIFTHLHAEWCKGEESKSGEIPEWLRKVASQGMSTFKQGLDRQ
jgi:hypothetical protein